MPAAKIQTSYTKAPLTIAVIGASHDHNDSYDVRGDRLHPARFAVTLSGILGRPVRAINLGISGDTTSASTAGGTWTTATAGMLNRIGCVTRYGVPSLVVINPATNDYTCISGGGALTGFSGLTAANVAANATKPNTIAMIDALVGAGVERIIVLGTHLYNFSGGIGDVTAGVIDAQASLTSDPGAVFRDGSNWAGFQAYLDRVAAYPGKIAWCDPYAFFKARLEADYPSWIGDYSKLNVAPGNGHLNATGMQWTADAEEECFRGTGWAEDMVLL